MTRGERGRGGNSEAGVRAPGKENKTSRGEDWRGEGEIKAATASKSRAEESPDASEE